MHEEAELSNDAYTQAQEALDDARARFRSATDARPWDMDDDVMTDCQRRVANDYIEALEVVLKLQPPN